jgi:hypothetical protein
MKRFKDNFKTRYYFAHEFLVVCPKCSSKAKVLPSVPWSSKRLFSTKRRLICTHCGFYKEQKPNRVIQMYGDRDWVFGLPLFYTICVKDGTLYAYNDEHLDYLKQFISAKLRTRDYSNSYSYSNRSQISRLPKWVKLAKNRNNLLKAIEKFEKK